MYSIDLCVDAKRCSEENLDKLIRETAYHFNCSNFFMTYESEINKKGNINCIFNIEYENEHLLDMLEFLNDMKATRYVHIECVFNNKIIHASSYYLTERIHKKHGKHIKNKPKKFSKTEQQIIDLLKK